MIGPVLCEVVPAQVDFSLHKTHDFFCLVSMDCSLPNVRSLNPLAQLRVKAQVTNRASRY